jgi:hypothetical protein
MTPVPIAVATLAVVGAHTERGDGASSSAGRAALAAPVMTRPARLSTAGGWSALDARCAGPAAGVGRHGTSASRHACWIGRMCRSAHSSPSSTWRKHSAHRACQASSAVGGISASGTVYSCAISWQRGQLTSGKRNSIPRNSRTRVLECVQQSGGRGHEQPRDHADRDANQQRQQ